MTTIRKKTIELQGIPEPLWAVIRDLAYGAGHPSITAYARSVLFDAAAKKAPHLWASATKSIRDARGIPDAMFIIHPHLKPPTDGDSSI